MLLFYFIIIFSEFLWIWFLDNNLIILICIPWLFWIYIQIFSKIIGLFCFLLIWSLLSLKTSLRTSTIRLLLIINCFFIQSFLLCRFKSWSSINCHLRINLVIWSFVDIYWLYHVEWFILLIILLNAWANIPSIARNWQVLIQRILNAIYLRAYFSDFFVFIALKPYTKGIAYLILVIYWIRLGWHRSHYWSVGRRLIRKIIEFLRAV